MNGNLEEYVIKLVEQVKELNKRVNDLEVKLDNLRVEYDHHDHPYKPEPRYGGIFGG
jgi:hypothetical protein